MEEAAPTLLLVGSKQLLELARHETSAAAESYAMLAARVISHAAGGHAALVLPPALAAAAAHWRAACASPLTAPGHANTTLWLGCEGTCPLTPPCCAARYLDQKAAQASEEGSGHGDTQEAGAAQQGEQQREGDDVASQTGLSLLSSIDVRALSLGAGAGCSQLGPAARAISPVGTLDVAALPAGMTFGSGRTGEQPWHGEQGGLGRAAPWEARHVRAGCLVALAAVTRLGAALRKRELGAGAGATQAGATRPAALSQALACPSSSRTRPSLASPSRRLLR